MADHEINALLPTSTLQRDGGSGGGGAVFGGVEQEQVEPENQANQTQKNVVQGGYEGHSLRATEKSKTYNEQVYNSPSLIDLLLERFRDYNIL